MSISRALRTINRGEQLLIAFNFEGDTAEELEGMPHVHIKVVEAGYASAVNNPGRFTPFEDVGEVQNDGGRDYGYVATSTPKLQVVGTPEQAGKVVTATVACNSGAADGIWEVECIARTASEVLRTSMLIHGADQ